MTGESPTTWIDKPHFRPWREIAILMLMVMEISWVTPWFRSLTPATYAIPPILAFLVLLGFMACSHLAVRVMERLHLRGNIRRWVTGGLLVVSVLIGLRYLLYTHERMGVTELLNRPLRGIISLESLIPDEFIITLVVLFGWWRGISLAQEHIEPSSVMGYYRLGIIMFIAFVIVNTMVTGETPGNFFYLFLFCGLVAMSTARISVLRTLRGGKQSTFDKRWFVGVIVVALAVVALAAGLAETLGNNLSWFNIIAMGIFGFLAIVMWALVSPILALIFYLMRNAQGDSPAVQQLAKTIENLQEIIRGVMQRLSDIVDRPSIMDVISRVFPYLRAILLWSIILVVAGGVIIWVAMRLWKERRRSQLQGDEQSMLEKGELWRMLQNYLRKQWENLLDGVANAVDTRRRQRARAAARIRQIYSDLLDLAEGLGCVRQEAQTPLEFVPALEACIQTVNTELETITNAYVKVRYGQLPESHQEVEEVEMAWTRVEERGKALMAEQERHKGPQATIKGKGAGKVR